MHQAYVVHRGHKRKARGFTCAEGEAAGLKNCSDWCALNLPWDPKRKTSYPDNVAYLKSLSKPAAQPAKAKKPAKAQK